MLKDKFGHTCETCLYSGAAQALEPCEACENHSSWAASLLYQEYLKLMEQVKEFEKDLKSINKKLDNMEPKINLLQRANELQRQNLSTLAAHLPECPADVLPPEFFSCGDITGCHGQEGITACWRRVLGVDTGESGG